MFMVGHSALQMSRDPLPKADLFRLIRPTYYQPPRVPPTAGSVWANAQQNRLSFSMVGDGSRLQVIPP